MSATDTGKCDVGMIFVHGIGEQAARATLMAWGEPIAADLQRAFASVGEVRIEAQPQMGAADCVKLITPTSPQKRTYLLTEARWAESFLVPSSSEVVFWTLRFAPRAIGRAARHTLRHLDNQAKAARGVTDFGVELGKREVTGKGVKLIPVSWAPQPPAFAISMFVILLGVLRVCVLGLVALVAVALVPALAVLLVVVLLLGLSLSWVPVVGRPVRRALTALSAVLGDATAWTSKPMRAAPMRRVVLDQILEMSTRAEKVIVVAHSQGAAVAADACFAEDAPPVDVVVTVGGGVNLLGRPAFPGAAVAADPIGAWAAKPGVRWINVWAAWDPVPSGPVAGTHKEARRRWMACLIRGQALADAAVLVNADLPSGKRVVGGLDAMAGPGQIEREEAAAAKAREDALKRRDELAAAPLPETDYPPGPEEWPVSNMGSLLRDHTTYSKNSVQVTRRLAALLENPDATLLTERAGAPGSEEARQVNRNAKYATYVSRLAVFRVAALPASVIVGLNVAGADALPRLSQYVDDAIAKKDGLLGWMWRASTTPEIVNAIVVSGVCLAVYLALSVIGTNLWRVGQTAMAASTTWSTLRTAPFFVLCTLMIVFSTVIPVAAASGEPVLSVEMYILVAVVYGALVIPLGPVPSELPARLPSAGPDA